MAMAIVEKTGIGSAKRSNEQIEGAIAVDIREDRGAGGLVRAAHPFVNGRFRAAALRPVLFFCVADRIQIGDVGVGFDAERVECFARTLPADWQATAQRWGHRLRLELGRAERIAGETPSNSPSRGAFALRC